MSFELIPENEMQNESAPGVQSRRYRLVDILPLTGPSSREMAIVQLIPEPGDDDLETIRSIESMFLPWTVEEQNAFLQAEDDVEKLDLPVIEYEVTIRRITPAPGVAS